MRRNLIEYYIYGRFKNIELFKANLDAGFLSIAEEMLTNFSIIDARFFGEVDEQTKATLD